MGLLDTVILFHNAFCMIYMLICFCTYVYMYSNKVLYCIVLYCIVLYCIELYLALFISFQTDLVIETVGSVRQKR